MKALNCIHVILITVFTTLNFISCSNNENFLDQEELVTVKLNLIGEITSITDEPLTKATSNDLLGIQVWRLTNNTNERECYAYGLFDNIENLELKLKKSDSYQITATLIVDGKNKIKYSNEYKGYSSPFTHSTSNNGIPTSISEQFIYSYYGFNELDYSLVSLQEGTFSRPNIERFYGTTESYTPSKDETININLYRVCFGVKYEVEGLTEGYLQINMEKAPIQNIEYPETKLSDIFSIINFHIEDRWKNDNYSEEINIKIHWIKKDGSSIPIADQNFTFVRNRRTIIKIKINQETPSEQNVNLSIDKEEKEITDGNEYNITN